MTKDNKLKHLWFTMQQAFKGENHDYTKGDISQAVILLAVPMILELSLESVFAVVDMFFVSKLGKNAIATVGLTESVVTIIYSLAIGISVGTTAIVARRVGAKDSDAASHAGAQSILLTCFISAFLGIFGFIYAKDILALMGASPEVVEEGHLFTKITLTANLPILLLFLINGIFRGAGNAAMAMRSLWVASALNIILCPIFIHFWGLPGAAMATVLGRSSGVLYQCYHLFKGDGVLQFTKRHFSLDRSVIGSIIAIASPASVQFIIGSGSWILLTRLVAETGGTEVSAAYQIAFRNFAFFILPAWGLSNAAATLVGQNLGAKQPDRAESSVYVTAKMSASLMFAVTVFILVFADPIVRIFTSDPQVLHHGIESLRIIGAGYVFYGIGMVMTQALNGAGDTKTPTWINLFCFWIFQTPLAYFLVKTMDIGAKGAMIVIPISHALLALIAWFYLKRGGWKATQV